MNRNSIVLVLKAALVASMTLLSSCAPEGASFDPTQQEAEEADHALGGAEGPLSFHVINREFPYHWDAILSASLSYPQITIASQNRPDSVPLDRWAKMVHTSHAPDGDALADLVAATLKDPSGAPRVVMIDELNEASVDVIHRAARRLRNVYPELAGRWGAFSTIFTGGQPAIDELLDAHAYIASERYIGQDWYCDQGKNGGERDIALARFFDGDDGVARFHWLTERKKVRSSQSELSVVFGVTDRYMNGKSPAVFLDRMFYVWVARTRHPGAIDIAHGGPGGWKWDPKHPDGGFGTSNTSRDLAFYESLQHYSVAGKKSSRLGPVPCD